MAEVSFARTKIQPPRPRAGLLLARPALEAALVAALETHRVVLVCAPAGFGKTALLGRTIAQLPAGQAAAWVSLDAGDDLHRLLACLTAALEPFDPPWRTAPEGLIAAAARPGPAAQQAVADELVNTLDACDVAHGVIVLDDLQHVTDAAGIVFLDHWLQRLPARWTVAIAARHEPPLRLARLRAAGELADFREARLGFVRDEVRRLAADAGLDERSADALHERTGGWPAGLRLALNGARGGSPGSTIDRQAFDFLASEVLAGLPAALREFLLRTSVLHDLDPARCAAVTGDAQAALQLDEIERLGLFASVVDDAQHTLRLHDLFRDALQHRARLERPQEWPLLLQRAAAVEGDPVRRQALLLAAGQLEPAARALLEAMTPLITQGGVNTLLHLCAQFPAAFADGSAELQRVSGMAKWIVWDARAAERHLARAEALYAARGDAAAAQAVRGHHAVTLIGLGRLDEAGRVLAALNAQPLEGEGRIIALTATGWHAMETGRYHDVAPIFTSLVRALEAAPVIETWFFTIPPPRQTACRGIGPALERWAATALAVAGDRPVPLRALGLLTQGWVALWQGRIADAGALLQRAEADAQWTGQQVVARSHSLAMRALVEGLRGDRDAALRTLHTRIAEHPAAYGDWGLWHHLFIASRIAGACGAVDALRDWLQRLLALQTTLPDADPERVRPAVALRGTLAAHDGRGDEAIACWREALQNEARIDLLGLAAEVRVRLALLLVQRRAKADAAAVLGPLFAAAGADGRPGGALLAGAALRELAAADLAGVADADQVASLRRWATCLGREGDAAPAPADGSADERLTGRELEVLGQIAVGASNKLIARALDLSPHTVKRHVANILDKLALSTRGQAAAWYRENAARGG